MKLKKYLIEAKQVGSLYHIVGIPQLTYIITHNSIKSRGYGKISTTKDKMRNYYVGAPPVIIGKFELDGNKISEKYKTSDFSFQSNTGMKLKEKEIVILTTELPNIWKYCKKFIFIKKEIDRDIKFINKNELKKLIIQIKCPLYIQIGSLIRKIDNKQLITWDLNNNEI